ncbi:MAG: hypothetical protein ACI9DC_000718 [Gammaproteobacteria bacterium]|jgi:hypothetical protein
MLLSAFMGVGRLVVRSVVLLLFFAPYVAAQDSVESTSEPLPPDYQIHADGSVTQRLCFNWSCASRQYVTFTAAEMANVAQQMALCPGDNLHDRLQRMRIGVWQMEVLAEKYQPVLANDQGLNDFDYDKDGRMDCIDNASNTSTALNVLHDFGLLPGWRMEESKTRNPFSLDVHWSAAVVDARDSEDEEAVWVIDSWFRANGHLPVVMPLNAWGNSLIGWEPPFSEWNHYPHYTEQLCSK